MQNVLSCHASYVELRMPGTWHGLFCRASPRNRKLYSTQIMLQYRNTGIEGGDNQVVRKPKPCINRRVAKSGLPEVKNAKSNSSG